MDNRIQAFLLVGLGVWLGGSNTHKRNLVGVGRCLVFLRTMGEAGGWWMCRAVWEWVARRAGVRGEGQKGGRGVRGQLRNNMLVFSNVFCTHVMIVPRAMAWPCGLCRPCYPVLPQGQAAQLLLHVLGLLSSIVRMSLPVEVSKRRSVWLARKGLNFSSC